MKLTLNILLLCSLFLMSAKGNCQAIDEIGTNPTTTRTKCTYGFTYDTSIRFDNWQLPDADNAIPINSQGAPDYSLINNVILPVVWKNIEASAYPDSSILKVQYLGGDNIIHYATRQFGPFILTFKPLAFVGGSSRNIPCYLTGPITIAINNYINTGNDYDKNEWITHHFEWTLPSGWQTSLGKAGTFVSGPSINVIPPASSSATSISVRAKANTQYSAMATLQITRNLEDFTVDGPNEVKCNETNRFKAPESSSGVTYTWQLPAGWTGVSNANYIDVVAQGPSGSIVCTMTGCNQTKVSSPKAVTVDIVNPNTAISGFSTIVCLPAQIL